MPPRIRAETSQLIPRVLPEQQVHSSGLQPPPSPYPADGGPETASHLLGLLHPQGCADLLALDGAGVLSITPDHS